MSNNLSKRTSLLRKALDVVSGLTPYCRRHWRWLAKGALAAAVVVVARLALPWPLRAVADLWIVDASSAEQGLLGAVTTLVDPGIAMGAAFLLILAVLGWGDFVERLYFARFSIAVVRDLRADAFWSVVRTDPRGEEAKPGDLIARLVGDTARVKAGLKGFLVHIATNVLVFVGVTLILFNLNFALGAIFAAAGLVTLTITISIASRVFRKSLKHRNKEGKLANAIQLTFRSGPDEARFARVNRSSGHHEASITRLQGVATWSSHVVFGGAVFAALWIGIQAVDAGAMEAGDMIIFMIYAVMMRGPVVRLARHGSRTGKILGSGYRVVQVIKESKKKEKHRLGAYELRPLRHQLRLCDVVVEGSKARGRRPRLGPIDIAISAGERILVVGGPGSGKTALLEVLAGLQRPHQGSVLWDDVDIARVNTWSLADHIAYVPTNPTWLRRPVKDLLGIAEQEPGDAVYKLIEGCGLSEVIARLPEGVDTKVGSGDLSPGERKLLALARQLRRNASVWLFDDPASVLSERSARSLVRGLLAFSQTATVVLATNRPVEADRFDRLIELQDARVVFDGTPHSWLTQQRNGAPIQAGIEQEFVHIRGSM
ncbi:MAG: ABC transporter ATP-binding protein [Planctomycetes bacterium]|nr:ABC transporter ATP-binding protein [Planctomycetota bacterium]